MDHVSCLCSKASLSLTQIIVRCTLCAQQVKHCISEKHRRRRRRRLTRLCNPKGPSGAITTPCKNEVAAPSKRRLQGTAYRITAARQLCSLYGVADRTEPRSKGGQHHEACRTILNNLVSCFSCCQMLQNASKVACFSREIMVA